jgi:DNA-directed RNA polymerase specialized sigma24 family protein
VAEEVAQDAWVGVLAQLDRFEGRSSLRTWVLRIVANRARTRAVHERRTPAQRAVITLRDVEQMTTAETCELLGLTEGNQRVLLHRARSRVRRALERYLDETEVVR